MHLPPHPPSPQHPTPCFPADLAASGLERRAECEKGVFGATGPGYTAKDACASLHEKKGTDGQPLIKSADDCGKFYFCADDNIAYQCQKSYCASHPSLIAPVHSGP